MHFLSLAPSPPRARAARTLSATACALFFAIGCGQDGASSLTAPEPTTPEAGVRQEIVESDVYKRDGERLYLFNAETGLNVLDLSEPRYPRRIGRLTRAALGIRAGELYAQDGQVIAVGRTASATCAPPPGLAVTGWRADTSVAVVDASQPQAPYLLSKLCLPGELVASRLLGTFLVLVTRGASEGRDGSSAHAYSVDLGAPEGPRVVADVALRGVSKEIHLTDERLFIASRADGCAYGCTEATRTRVDVLAMSALDGKLTRGGAVTVRGEPQGRFHMDARGDYFRIVTYDPARRDSVLHVLDVSAPDAPKHVAELGGLGRGERLFATRFDGDRAYVVTFRQTDPLWIIDLRRPDAPRLVGELHVPGWSDFIFPRGDQLLAVGRTGVRGALQVSLFDVSDPQSPRALSQLQVGDVGGTSAANVDHRAVTVLEPSGDDAYRAPLVVVPFGIDPNAAGCSALHLIQLVEIQPSRLVVRGVAEQTGQVQRTFAAGDVLLGISNHEVRSFDLRDRDFPVAEGIAIVGTRDALTCSAEYAPAPVPATVPFVQPLDNDLGNRRMRLFCSAPQGEATLLSVAFLMALLGLLLRARRRRG